MTTKTCTRCGETKTVDQFHKNRANRDGLQHRCKDCQRAYYKANREQIAAQRRAYNEANREQIAAQRRAYYKANRDKIAAYSRAYYEANREECNARDRARHALVGKPHTDRAQSITEKHATRKYDPWTHEEDRHLLTGPGTIMDKALQLSRTYESVARRAAKLRRQEQTA